VKWKIKSAWLLPKIPNWTIQSIEEGLKGEVPSFLFILVKFLSGNSMVYYYREWFRRNNA
jgi:hypothetical protein